MESVDKTIESGNTSVCGCGSCGVAGENGVERAEATAERRDERRLVYVPAVDVIEGEGEVTVYADVPGVGDGGVELTVEKDVLTLVARPAELGVEGYRLAYSEYGVGEYRCSFGLSDGIDREGISASLRDGVLRVSLPKSAPVTRKVSVSVG